MRALHPVLFFVAISAATCAVAQGVDGSAPLSCKVLGGFDCLPGQASCAALKPESKTEPVYTINLANKEVHTPYRTSLLKIANTSPSTESLILQGADASVAWSAIIKKASGDLTITVADRKGAYVAFGQCQVAKPAPK